MLGLQKKAVSNLREDAIGQDEEIDNNSKREIARSGRKAH
jgi:hypothetical protein